MLSKNELGLLSSSSSLDDDILRSVDAFSEDEKEVGGGASFLMEIRNKGMSEDNIRELLNGHANTSMMSQASARTLKDRCKTVNSVLRTSTQERSKSSMSARGRALSRTEIKLIE